jgi:hypothetical protein
MKKRLRPRLTYANVISTLALFLALSGGAAYAASKIHSGDIANGAIKTSKMHKRAVTSAKLALGAVRSNQIANGAVSSSQIGAGSVAPSNLQFPLYFAASPTGGSAPVPSGGSIAYPLSDSTWTQKPGQINVVFGAAVARLAYDGSGSGSCRVSFEISLNGRRVDGGGELWTGSTGLEQVEQSLGAQPEIDPLAPKTNSLTMQVHSNGDCTPDSVVDSTRFRVLDFG